MKIEQYKNEPFYNKLVILKDYAERLKLDLNITIEYYSDKVDFILTFGARDFGDYDNFNIIELQEVMNILECKQAFFNIRIDINGGRRIGLQCGNGTKPLKEK